MNEHEVILREALAERAGVAPDPRGSGSKVLHRARGVQRRRRVAAAVVAAGVCAALAVSVVPRLSAPAVPAGPPRVGSTTSTGSISVAQQREAARAWAAGLPAGGGATFTGLPVTARVGDRVDVRVDGAEVAGLAGVPDLADLHRTATGWLAFAPGGLPDGSYSLLHYQRGESRARVLGHPPARTPLLLDPSGRRVALLWPGGAMSIIDLDTGASQGLPLPQGASRPALATWTDKGISLVEGAADTADDTSPSSQPLVGAGGGADTTRVWRLEPSTATWGPATTLGSRIVRVQQPDDVGGAPTSAVVLDRRGERACVSLLAAALDLEPLRCWTGALRGTPTAVMSPGGRHALVGMRGDLDGDVELFDLTSGKQEPRAPGGALVGDLDSYVWESQDTFAAVAGPERVAGVPFRLDVSTGTAQRLSGDPLDAYLAQFDPARTGLNLSAG